MWISHSTERQTDKKTKNITEFIRNGLFSEGK